MGRRQNRGGGTGRRRPYNQSQTMGRPYQDPQNLNHDNQGYNQNYNYQDPGIRRRGRREYNPQTRDNRPDTNESNLVTMLKRLVEKF